MRQHQPVHAATVGQRSASRLRKWLAVAFLVACLSGVSACTASGESPAVPTSSSSSSLAPGPDGPAPVGGLEQAACRPTAISDPRGLLTLTEVWGSDNGARTATRLDLSRCHGVAFSAAAFVCRLPFPWLSAADAAGQLAAIGAEQVRVSRLVAPGGPEVTETVVTFTTGARPGAAALRRQALECGATLARRGADTTAWYHRGGTTLAVRTSGTLAVAVEYVGTGLSRHRQEVLLERAVDQSPRLAPG